MTDDSLERFAPFKPVPPTGRIVFAETETSLLQQIRNEVRWIRKTIMWLLWSYFAVYVLTDLGPAFLKFVGL